MKFTLLDFYRAQEEILTLIVDRLNQKRIAKSKENLGDIDKVVSYITTIERNIVAYFEQSKKTKQKSELMPRFLSEIQEAVLKQNEIIKTWPKNFVTSSHYLAIINFEEIMSASYNQDEKIINKLEQLFYLEYFLKSKISYYKLSIFNNDDLSDQPELLKQNIVSAVNHIKTTPTRKEEEESAKLNHYYKVYQDILRAYNFKAALLPLPNVLAIKTAFKSESPSLSSASSILLSTPPPTDSTLPSTSEETNSDFFDFNTEALAPKSPSENQSSFANNPPFFRSTLSTTDITKAPLLTGQRINDRHDDKNAESTLQSTSEDDFLKYFSEENFDFFYFNTGALAPKSPSENQSSFANNPPSSFANNPPFVRDALSNTDITEAPLLTGQRINDRHDDKNAESTLQSTSEDDFLEYFFEGNFDFNTEALAPKYPSENQSSFANNPPFVRDALLTTDITEAPLLTGQRINDRHDDKNTESTLPSTSEDDVLKCFSEENFDFFDLHTGALAPKSPSENQSSVANNPRFFRSALPTTDITEAPPRTDPRINRRNDDGDENGFKGKRRR